jgi:hypothetical protein
VKRLDVSLLLGARTAGSGRRIAERDDRGCRPSHRWVLGKIAMYVRYDYGAFANGRCHSLNGIGSNIADGIDAGHACRVRAVFETTCAPCKNEAFGIQSRRPSPLAFSQVTFLRNGSPANATILEFVCTVIWLELSIREIKYWDIDSENDDPRTM